MSRVTLKDVSVRAGVSRSTASLVLRGSSRISAETSERVRAAMAELGYVYDRAAATLRQSRTMTLGLVMTDLRNPFFAELTMVLEEAVHDVGYTLVIGYSRDEPEREKELLEVMAERRVDGLFLMPASDSDPEVLDRLQVQGIPTVLFARHLGTDEPYVGPDNREAGRMLGAHLRSIGIRSAVLLGGPRRSSARTERVDGIISGSAGAFAFDPDEAIFSATSSAAGTEVVSQLLDGGQLPDCIIAYSDVIAVGINAGLRQRGFEPGKDIAVAGFDDIQVTAQQVPPLTSVATHADQVGAACAERLLGLISGGDGSPRGEPVLIPPSLKVRASTGLWRPRREN